MSLNLIVGDEYLFFDCVVDLLYLRHMLDLGYSVDPSLQLGYFAAGWFELSIYLNLLNYKSLFSALGLDLLDC